MSEAQVTLGKSVLGYQPFRLSETVMTGVGYSWLYEAASRNRLNRPHLVFDRAAEPLDVWAKAVAANHVLERTYQAFMDVIAQTCPGGSYLDLCGNTGWFAIAAALRGMTRATVTDGWDFGGAVKLLNEITGADARFFTSVYRSPEHSFHSPIVGERFDVVSNMAFIVHVPDPLNLLKAIADFAEHAVFLWSAFPRSDERLIRYGGANQFFDAPFPWCFDSGASISDTLLIESMEKLGFPKQVEITPLEGGWPTEWENPLMKPYQPLRAFLFTRS